MKTLFVCSANVGRSQMAMAYYNSKHREKAESAGTAVDIHGQVLHTRTRASNAIAVMNEIGLDISHNTRRQLYEKDISNFERVIVLCESAAIPDYLKHATNVTFWSIDDPAHMNIDDTREIRDEIIKSVDTL